jgi:capsular exopolysaccharide synthesis family protein
LTHQEEGNKSSSSQLQWGLLFTVYKESTMKRLNDYLYRMQRSQPRSRTDLIAQSDLSESLRMLQVSLGPPLAGAARVILVTSSMVGEGKTFISSRLAVLLAQEGHRVLLVDGDLRHPSLHRVFQVPLAPGLAQFRATGEGLALSELVLQTDAGIALVPGGDAGPGSSEVWARISPPALFKQLKESPYSFVIMDSPPLLVAAETSLLASRADDVLLVVRAGSTRENAVRQARVLLERNHAKLRGIVLNDQADYLQPTYMRESHPYRGPGKLSAPYSKEEEEISPLNPASENS